ncbi:MAG: hypothetical protein AAB676_01335, partial [Verrucomicrobiota bacterium]
GSFLWTKRWPLSSMRPQSRHEEAQRLHEKRKAPRSVGDLFGKPGACRFGRSAGLQPALRGQ